MKFPFRIKVAARTGSKLAQMRQLYAFRNRCQDETLLYVLEHSRRDMVDWNSRTAAFEIGFTNPDDALMFKLSWSEEILEDG